MALENIRKHIILDVSKNRYVVVVIKQYDKDTREIIVKVTEDGKPYPINNTIVPRFKCQKTDGTKIYNDCTILENGDVKIDITEQLTIVAGMHDCELVLYDATSNAVLHTMSFIVNVKDSVFPDDEVVSSDEFNALQEALLKADSLNVDVIKKDIKDVKQSLTEHTQDTDNPHNVTKSQIGLENVDNTSDANKPVSTAQQNALDLKVNITDYEFKIAELERQDTLNSQATTNAYTKAQQAENDLESHINLSFNPHNVTAEQVGLGNVDNTADVDKPVSTAQQKALDLKEDIENVIGENLLEFPYYNNTMTSNGITFTVNADGSVTANGTASAATNFIFTHRIDNKVILPKGTYTVSGCPSGGGSNSYYLQIAKTLNNSFYLIGADTGKGFTFTLEEETDILIAIYIASGVTVSNLVFKPMLEVGSVAHPYQPYNLSKKGLVEQMIADNILPYPYKETTHTQNEVLWTDLGDGRVRANGTNTHASSASQFYFNQDTPINLKPNTTYTLSGCPSGGTASTYAMRIFLNYGVEGQVVYRDIGNGVTFTTPSNYQHCRIMIDVYAGATANNLTFEPMLEVGTVIHPYQPYNLSRQKLRNDIDAIGTGGGGSNTAYATCSTAAATSEKVVTIDGNENWMLQKGSIVVVKFTNTNTATNCTLNVNNTGAKQVWYNNGVNTSNSNVLFGYANRYITYMYDGTYWVWIGQGYNTTYNNATLGQGYGTCTTAEATTAKVVTLSNYSLTVGGIVSVKFTYAVPASATMNINSRGAKNIFYRGSAITANVIKAGDIATFIYDGTQYHIISIDRGINNMLTTSDVVDNVTSTSTTLPLSANQGKALNDRIDSLQPLCYSLARNTDIGVLTTTQTTYNTFNSRKFSDYGMILFTIGASNTDVRATLVISRKVFDGSDGANPRTLYIDCWSNSGQTFNQVIVKWVSDTSFIAYLATSGTVTKYLNIYGVKVAT